MAAPEEQAREQINAGAESVGYWIGSNWWWIVPLCLLAFFTVRAVVMNRRGD